MDKVAIVSQEASAYVPLKEVANAGVCVVTLVNKQVSEESPNIELHTRGVTANPSGHSPVFNTSNNVNHQAMRISMKLKEGDCRGAVRLACSEDVFAERNSHTLA